MLGQSFAPLGDQNDPMKGQAGNGPISPVQEAIRVLSLRMPRTPGAGGIAPQALLNAPGMAGVGSATGPTNQLEDLLRRLLGGASGPAPHVIPGIDEGEPMPGSFHPGGFDPPPPAAPPVRPAGRPQRDPGFKVGNNGGRAFQV